MTTPDKTLGHICTSVCDAPTTNDKFIEEIVKSVHLKWLKKAHTAKINGSEMTVLSYGYLGQALKEALLAQRTEILKRMEGVLPMKLGFTGHPFFEDGYAAAIADIRTSLQERGIKIK